MKRILSGVLLALALGNADAASKYVASSGDDSDGSTWAKAYKKLQSAIDAASPGDTIYVKGETFTLAGPNPANPATGKLYWGPAKRDLTIVGGYQGIGPEPGPTTNTATVLLNTAIASVDTNRVLYVSAVTNGTLRNITIQGGRIGRESGSTTPYINAYGAGAYVSACVNLRLEGVAFVGNYCLGSRERVSDGGGAYLVDSSGLVSNCQFQANTAMSFYQTTGRGLGLHIANGTWTVRDSIIRNNMPYTEGAYGHTVQGIGLYVNGGTHTIKNCAISRNYDPPDNTAAQGDAAYVAGGTVTFENCTLLWHRVEGLRRAGGTVTVRDCIIWDCGDDLVPGAAPGIALSYSNVEDTDTGTGVIHLNPQFERGLYLASASPCVNTGSTSAASAGLGAYTTRSDGTADAGAVDLGYHAAPGAAAMDLYVAVGTGNDGNTGASPGAALKSITRALAKAGNGTRIHVAAGNYTSATETFPLAAAHKYGLELIGTDAAKTVVSAAGANRQVMTLSYCYPGSRVEGLTLTRGSWNTVVQAQGGGLYLYHCQADVDDCVITNNYLYTSTWADGNSPWGSKGAGVYASASQGAITDCLVANNLGEGWYPLNMYGGGLFLEAGTWTLDRVRVSRNTTSVGGSQYGTTSAFGGGLYLNATCTLRNCLIDGNDAKSTSTTGKVPRGDAAYVAGGTVAFENCTVVTNHPVAHARAGDSYTAGLGIERAGTSTVNIRNSILWGNGDDLIGTIALLRYSNIEDGDVGDGTCISANPQFVSLAAGDYRLTKSSASLNVGEYQSWMAGATDLDGRPRIQSTYVDLGAYETWLPGTLMLLR